MVDSIHFGHIYDQFFKFIVFGLLLLGYGMHTKVAYAKLFMIKNIN